MDLHRRKPDRDARLEDGKNGDEIKNSPQRTQRTQREKKFSTDEHG
jgi:hypothetical protein